VAHSYGTSSESSVPLFPFSVPQILPSRKSTEVNTMSSFGKWYDDQKAAENNEAGNYRNSWLPSSEVLPLFDSSEMPTFSGIKAAMEAQMPQNIMGMNYQQRFKMFCGLLFLSALFFALGFFVGLPLVALRPQKFALCFTFGSLTFMASFGVLKGPLTHLQGMLAPDRIVFTTIYLGSMFLTLYFTFRVKGATGYLLVLGSSGSQFIVLFWYLISFLPGGSAGLSIVLSAIYHILKPVLLGCSKVQAMIVGKCLSIWMASNSS